MSIPLVHPFLSAWQRANVTDTQLMDDALCKMAHPDSYVSLEERKEIINTAVGYLSNIRCVLLATFNVTDLYYKSEDKWAILPDGTVKPGLPITFGVYKVTDNNLRQETGRSINKTFKAKELPDGRTISYVVAPLEEYDLYLQTNFVNIKDLSKTKPIFDPRLEALRTYRAVIADLAFCEKAYECLTFSNSFMTINDNKRFVPLYFENYCAGVVCRVLSFHPELLNI